LRFPLEARRLGGAVHILFCPLTHFGEISFVFLDCDLIIAPIWGNANQIKKIIPQNGTFVDYAVFYVWRIVDFFLFWGKKIKPPLTDFSARGGKPFLA
jgi:hypothetical protein